MRFATNGVSAPPTTRLQRAWAAIAAGGAALRHRNYRLFFWGQLISLIGTWMQSLAQVWLVYTLSHSAFQLGVVSAFQFLPVLLFSLFAGVIVDRVPKRGLIILTQILFMVLAAALGVLVLSRQVQIWHVYVIAALYGVVNAFDVPARQAFMVEMVGREDLLNGIALNSSIFNGSRIFGPALAALLIAQVGTGICFIINAASFIAVIIGLCMMRVERKVAAPMTKRRPLKQIGEGLGYIRANERVWLIFAIVSVISVFGIPCYATLMPIFATKVLHAGVGGLGVLQTTLGIGALVGAMLLAYMPPGPARGRLLLGSAIIFGILLAVFGTSHSLALSAALIAVIGFSVVSVNSAGNALIQESVPDELRGRVMSVWGLVLIGLGPFGSFFAGSLGDWVGAPLTVIISGAICLVAALYFNVIARRDRVLRSVELAPVGTAPLEAIARLDYGNVTLLIRYTSTEARIIQGTGDRRFPPQKEVHRDVTL